jgi:hypothetical protein
MSAVSGLTVAIVAETTVDAVIASPVTLVTTV